MVNVGYNRNFEHFLVEAERFEETGNYKMAARALRRGAAEGNTNCQLNLGNYYTAGKGVRKSMQRAAYWYRKAYKSGDRSGAFNLALVKRDQGDFRWAEFWLKKAVAMRDGSAHVELAKIYISRDQNIKAAAALLRRTTRMSADDVSDEEKAEAEALLGTIRLSPLRKRKKSGIRARRQQPKSSSHISKARRTR
jgi:TPR repeat protein